MRNLQGQRTPAKNLQAVTRVDGFFPLLLLLVDPAELFESLDLVAGALRKLREQDFRTIQ